MLRRVASRTFHYSREGSGPPVILLHSSGLIGAQWKRTVTSLRDRFECTCPDLWGAGQSDVWGPAPQFRVEDELVLLGTLLDDLGPSSLVGHSYGGLVALQGALRWPERVKSVTVFEPVALSTLQTSSQPGDQAEWESLQQPFWLDEQRGGSADWVRQFIEYWSGPGAFAALPGPVQAQFIQAGPVVFGETVACRKAATTLEEYGRMKARLQVIRGGASTKTAARVCELLAGAVPGAKLHTIEGAPHMGPMTHAAQFNGLVSEWLSSGG